MNDHRTPLSQRVLTIRTPENVELTYALAGPGSRAAAYLVDFFIMSIAGQLGINLIASGAGLVLSSLGEIGEAWAAAIAGLLLFALYNSYFIFLEWLLNGQTPGKRLVHIRVIKQGGYSLRFFDTLLRNLLRVIDFLPLFYGVGLTSLLLTRDSQRLGDLVAGTLVVYQDPVQTGSLLPELPESATEEPLLAADQLAATPPEAIALAALYLRSRDELGTRARQEVAAELAGLIHEHGGLSPRPGQGVENFLTSVVRQSAPAPPWSGPSEPEAAPLS